MTAPPAGAPGGTEIPRLLSAQFRAASITEFAYLTPRGEPLCWPVTPYWYPERGILGISTGLGYPNKAYYAQRHPRVAALFGSTLLQGDAVVLEDPLAPAGTTAPAEVAKPKQPAPPIDTVLQRAVQLHRTLLALKKL